MGWYFDDYDDDNYDQEYDEEQQSGRERLIGFAAGVMLAAVTLLLVTVLILTTTGYFFLSDSSDSADSLRLSRYQPQTPSADDLLNANYRSSDWQAASPNRFITPTPISPDVIAEADAEFLLLTNIYQRVNPAVVNIEIVSAVHSTLDIIDSSGSGFVLDTDGHIVTNAHVVREAEEILVTFYDGYVADAEIIGIDDYSDLAVLRVESDIPGGLVPVELGDSNTLVVGQRVIAIGNPFGLEGSMTVGIVSALGRSLPSASLLDSSYLQYSNPSIIQVDASVNPGNSGGPLLDSYGRVIGINTAIRTESGVFQGIAFAVPVNTVKRIVPQLISSGKVQYSWLGISSPPTESGLSVAALADQFGFPVRNGILISDIVPDSPAAHAGLRAGTEQTQVRGTNVPTNSDIIVAVNGVMLRDIDDLVAFLVENTSPGDRIVLTIVRNGETLDLDVTLGVRP